jgi:hypothetical protein
MSVDPTEEDPQLIAIVEAAAKEAEVELAAYDMVPGRMGYCHVLWGTQQRILKQKYGIDWKTPAELRPWATFD